MKRYPRHDPIDDLVAVGGRLRAVQRLRAEHPRVADLAQVEQNLAQTMANLAREAASWRPFVGYALK